MKRRFCYCDAFLIYKTFKISIQNEAETIKKQVKKQLRFWHRFFRILTPISERFWRTFWPLGRLLGALGRLLDTSWAYLGRSWASLGRFWASWAPLGRILSASWAIWGRFLRVVKRVSECFAWDQDLKIRCSQDINTCSAPNSFRIWAS